MKKRRRVILVLMGLGAIAAVGGVALTIYKDRVWVETPDYVRQEGLPAQTIVVVYSRTGNTLGAAKEAARYFDADLLEIRSPRYPRDLKGLSRAADDASHRVRTVPIEHQPVDLADYRLVVLCSPTWLFRPAPPLWTFAEHHDFSGRSVFVLMTGNSRLKQENIDEFGTLVESKGGRFLGNLFIRRGRIYWQKSTEAVDAEVRRELAKRYRLWPDEVTHE